MQTELEKLFKRMKLDSKNNMAPTYMLVSKGSFKSQTSFLHAEPKAIEI